MVKRGVTLPELLVAMLLFSMVLVVVLGFYGQAWRVSQAREEDSRQFRRAITALDRIEITLRTAKVFQVNANAVVFAELDKPEVFRGFPNWKAEGALLAVIDGQLFIRRGDVITPIATLEPGESVVFSYQRWKPPPEKIGEELLRVDWHYEPPKKDAAAFSYNRMIPMERYSKTWDTGQDRQ